MQTVSVLYGGSAARERMASSRKRTLTAHLLVAHLSLIPFRCNGKERNELNSGQSFNTGEALGLFVKFLFNPGTRHLLKGSGVCYSFCCT